MTASMEQAHDVEPRPVDPEPVTAKVLSVVIPVYKNEESIPRLCACLTIVPRMRSVSKAPG